MGVLNRSFIPAARFFRPGNVLDGVDAEKPRAAFFAFDVDVFLETLFGQILAIPKNLGFYSCLKF